MSPAPKRLTDGWWVPHPGTAVWVATDTFREAMDTWFEGWNFPRYVEHGEMEDLQEAIDRVMQWRKKTSPASPEKD